MKHYQILAKQPTFSLSDACKTIGKIKSTKLHLQNMIKDGSVHRIRKNLYTCVNFATGGDCANHFQIASSITDDSFISYHTAFEFYGCYNQVYYEIQTCSLKKFSPFTYDNYYYKCFLTSSLLQIETIQGVRVVTIERAIIDSINMLGKVMDAEELTKCLDLIPMVNESKLMEMLEFYDKEILYRKVGYVLSFYKNELSLSDAFFDTCKKRSLIMNRGYLINNDRYRLVYNSEWGLYAYEDLKKLSYKGGECDV